MNLVLQLRQITEKSKDYKIILRILTKFLLNPEIKETQKQKIRHMRQNYKVISQEVYNETLLKYFSQKHSKQQIANTKKEFGTMQGNIIDLQPKRLEQLVSQEEKPLVLNKPIVSNVQNYQQCPTKILEDSSCLYGEQLVKYICALTNSSQRSELVIAKQVNQSSISVGFQKVYQFQLENLVHKIEKALKLIRCRAFQTKWEKIVNQDFIKIRIKAIPVFKNYVDYFSNTVNSLAIKVSIRLDPILSNKKLIRPLFYISHPPNKLNAAPVIQYWECQIGEDGITKLKECPISSIYSSIMHLAPKNKKLALSQKDQTFYEHPQQILIIQSSQPSPQPCPTLPLLNFPTNQSQIYNFLLNQIMQRDLCQIPLIDKNEKIIQIQVSQKYQQIVEQKVQKFLRDKKIQGKFLIFLEDLQRLYVQHRRSCGFVGYFVYFVVFKGNYVQVQASLKELCKNQYQPIATVVSVFDTINIGSAMTESQINKLQNLFYDKFCSIPKILKIQTNPTWNNQISLCNQKNFINVQIKVGNFERHVALFSHFLLQMTGKRPKSSNQKQKVLVIKKFEFNNNSVDFFSDSLNMLKNENLKQIFKSVEPDELVFQYKIEHTSNKQALIKQVSMYLQSLRKKNFIISYRYIQPLKEYQEAAIKQRKKQSGNPQAYYHYYFIFKFEGKSSELEQLLFGFKKQGLIIAFVNNIIVLPIMKEKDIKKFLQFYHQVFDDKIQVHHADVAVNGYIKNVRFEIDASMPQVICSFFTLQEARLRAKCYHADKISNV